MPREVEKTIQIDHCGAIGSYFEILQCLRKNLNFWWILIGQKFVPTIKQIRKMDPWCGSWVAERNCYTPARGQGGFPPLRARKTPPPRQDHPRATFLSFSFHFTSLLLGLLSFSFAFLRDFSRRRRPKGPQYLQKLIPKRSKMASKTDPKIKRKLTFEITRKSWKNQKNLMC